MTNGIINYLRTFNDCLVLLCIEKKATEGMRELYEKLMK